ncbi:MAG: uroporphyrinogen-III C-methyltransferase [Gammaproteobacteria bacterium]|nr:uroporphyrinogen-III C-methyltransferase [Gammaproteobacteria bacterium]MBQ0838427.1 uroporphyrinogen-III C-methyltransferase [Gammaproteobacteria bacterium]
MNNKKQVDSTQDKVEVGSTPEAKTQGKIKKPATGRGWRLLAILLLLVLVAGVGGVVWFGQGFLLQLHALDNTVAQKGTSLDTFQQSIERKAAEQGLLVASFEQKLTALQQEQQSQLALLESKGNAGRGKLLLDEADFLIRLANQRLLVERRPQGAQTLLESADQVLAKLDDPGLIALRKTLSENIAELRRTTIIDREGIFLRIATLSDLMMTFPALPVHGLEGVEVVDGAAPAEEAAVVVEQVWYQYLWQNMRKATQGFVDRHFHVRSLEQPLAPLMSIDRETQLRHSLLITLGNAQQAVLREEGGIYRASLVRAENDITRYFALNDDTRGLIEQLKELQAEAVEQELPDISASLYVLRDYRAVTEHRRGNGEG